MKRFATIAALLFAAAILIGFTGCKKEPEITYYTVSFDTDGAGDIASQKIAEGTLATKPEDPAKTGYTFGGWYNGETAFDFATPITADTSLKAKWTANTYKVTLVVKGDTAEDDVSTEITVTYDQKIQDLAVADIPAKTGLVFGGYYTEEHGCGIKFIDKDGKGCEVWNFAENKTLYAAFGNSITFNNTKDVANSNPDVYIVGKGLVSLAALDGTAIGYTFDGWSRTDGGSAIGTDEAAIATSESTPQEFWAVWTPIEYTITYDGIPAGATNSNQTTYNVETETFALVKPVKAGYRFYDWTDAQTGGNIVSQITKGSIGNKTVYTKINWYGTKLPTETKVVYDIVFSDGSATPYTENMSLTNDEKAAAIAVIFYAGGDSYIGERTLGFGLNCNTEKKWCKDGNVTGSRIRQQYDYYNGKNNMQVIKVLEDYSEDNYPAAYWCDNYGSSETNLVGTAFEDGWYLPTFFEMKKLFGEGNEKPLPSGGWVLNNAVYLLKGYSIPKGYHWTSQWYYSTNNQSWNESGGKAMEISFDDGNGSYWPKSDSYKVNAIREF